MRGVSEGMFLCGVLTNNEAELCQVQLLSMLQLTMDTEEPLLTQNIDQQYIDDDMIRVVIVCRLIGINVSPYRRCRSFTVDQLELFRIAVVI